MTEEFSHAKELVENPSESLTVEIKRWINPDSIEGQSKIIRAALALRNHGGGYLVIGFDNKAFHPDTENTPKDVRNLFHLDKIQGMITRFSSEAFEIAIAYPSRENQEYPVIIIPSGVKTPVASKSELKSDSKTYISVDEVFVRTLLANNTPSTTRIRWKDWPKLLEVCFDNREADIGRFFRRHLSSIEPQVVREFLMRFEQEESNGHHIFSELNTRSNTSLILENGYNRYNHVKEERELTLPEFGKWEVALNIKGVFQNHSANLDFLNLVGSQNPNYSGWPVWLNSYGFTETSAKPYVFEDAWEALIVVVENKFFRHIDFVRMQPTGQFYQLRAFLEDTWLRGRQADAPTPFQSLDFKMPIQRCAESIAVGINIAQALGCKPEETTLEFAFRWSKLQGRELVSWVDPARYISPGRKAYQNAVSTTVEVPLETPHSAVGGYVYQVVKPLFEIFDGFMLGSTIVDEITTELLSRRM